MIHGRREEHAKGQRLLDIEDRVDKHDQDRETIMWARGNNETLAAAPSWITHRRQ
jgi:hypothetical protein